VKILSLIGTSPPETGTSHVRIGIAGFSLLIRCRGKEKALSWLINA
jgi:hypothetical protein